jgi:MoxR-like ATPase
MQTAEQPQPETVPPPSTTSFDGANRFCDDVRRRVAEVVVGQDAVVERILIALFTGGHLMLQGVPGLAKTLLVNAVARAVDLQFSRIQFTIDLLPSDIVGSEVLDQKTGEFRVQKGPIFANLLLADEINRAAPKAQSAMLEAMQERKVTIGGQTFSLPVPFLVIATQNPVEQSGTFELPEAQLDRFMLYHRLDYPTPDEEQDILRRQLAMGLKKDAGGAVPKTAFDMIAAEPCATIADLVRAMEAVQQVQVSEVFIKHSVELVRRTRHSKLLDFGCSPRACLALAAASRARAFLHGRDYVVPEDLFELAEDVMLHRIRLTYEAAAEGHTGREILESILSDLS